MYMCWFFSCDSMVICGLRSNSAALQCVDRILYDSIRHHWRFQNLTEGRGIGGGGGELCDLQV